MLRNEPGEIVLKATADEEEELDTLIENLSVVYKVVSKSRIMQNDRYGGYHSFVTIKPIEEDS